MPEALVPALAAIIAETTAACEWLSADVDGHEPISFVPNPGNIGDAAINVACHAFLEARFDRIELRAMAESPPTECVFVGGGGNLVEPLYSNVRDWLGQLDLRHRLFMFPATIRGFSAELKRFAGRSRILCRDPITFAYVTTQIPREHTLLSHDAAFLLGPRLRHDLASRIDKATAAKCRSFRNDSERVHAELGGLDIMAHYQGAWTDMAFAYQAVIAAARFLAGFDEVETDRLHCAIVAAMLGRRTVLRANSYFKNAAVFAHSLARLPNTAFLEAVPSGAGAHVPAPEDRVRTSDGNDTI